ncbi:MAG: TonB-dependent receptor [Acidobacteria bacterium]|nr:MAG: TonB-dependent receptor [Acidobacteriota bacterium]
MQNRWNWLEEGQSMRKLFVLLMMCVPAVAQTTSGSIVGKVTDPTGGVVAAAAVSVMNMNTGIETKSSSDGSGNFVVTPLPVGNYTVTVEAPGFKKWSSSGINLNVQDRIGLNVVLEVGQVSETVEVVGAAPALQTDTSYLGQVVESKRIEELPLNGRYFTRLAVLTAGTIPTAPGARDERTGGFSSNGVRPYQNNYLLDGVDNNSLSEDLTNESSFVYGPSPDAISEFKVQTNSMSAEFGRSGGAVMNVTIKSGSNGLHGSLFEFLRNEKFDAKNFFDPGDKPIAAYKQNQFGGALGGPIIKNRTFFFADYQGTRIRQALTAQATLAPLAWRTGDFSGFHPILDPNTTVIQGDQIIRQPFPDNKITPDRFDQAAVNLIALMPSPNVRGSVSDKGVANNYLTNPIEPNQTDQGDIRIDHKISDKDSIFGRFSMADQTLTPPSRIPPPLSGAQFSSGDWLNYSRNVVLTETHIFSPRVVNEFRAGYTRLRTERLQFNSNDNLSAQVGIPGIPFTPGNGGLPRFGVSGLTNFGSATYQPTREFENVFHFIETLSVITGRHTLKFGAEWKPRVDFSILQPPVPRGRFSFSGDFTRDANNRSDTGLGFADFLLGKVSGSLVGSFINDTFQQPGYFFYVQDDFKVTSKLTLNLGMRYEFISMPRERRDAEANYNIATGTFDIPKGRTDPLPDTFFPEITVNRNAPRQLVPQDRNNFAPRVGFAYQLTPKTVIRSGYGIFYSSYEAGPLSIPNPGNNPPFYAESDWNPVNFATPNPIVNQLSNGIPANAFAEPAAVPLFALDPNFRNPYVQHWNFSVQRDLGFSTVWEISYAGSSGKKLYEFRNVNQPTPTADSTSDYDSRRPRPFLANDLTYWCSCNSSTYHGLQTKVEKRFSNGLSFLGAYTWGKSIDEQSQASLGFDNSTGARSEYNYRAEKGRSDYDIAHRLVVSYSYDLPFGRNKTGAAKLLMGGWQLLGIHSFNTGNPNTIHASSDFSNADGDARPDVIAGVSDLPAGGRSRQVWFNPAAFQNPGNGLRGNVGRNTLSGPGTINIDLSLFKTFTITERWKLQFRSEFFNLPNHPNFRSLDTTFDDTAAGSLNAAAAPRQIQFALKLLF